MKKMYFLVVTDDYSSFSWIFFLATKDETSGILKSFITGVENLIDQRVNVIRCDNGTKFKNKDMNQFYERKYIKREFSVARTPQQNRVAERKNRKLIEAARTMLADSKLPTTFLGLKQLILLLCTKACDDAGKARMETSSPDAGFKPLGNNEKKVTKEPGKEGGDSSKDSECSDQEKEDNVNNTNNVNAASTNEVNAVGEKTSTELPDDLNMPELEDIVYSDNDEDVGAEDDMNNLDAFIWIVEELLSLIVRLKVEVYVCQPSGFEDPDFPDRVYKVEKALYGLNQASRAWYETLSTYLLDNGFQRGKTDKNLFIRRDKGDILDASKAKEDGIFYQPLLKDEDGEEVDVHLYRSMIGSLMYLTSSRPDIIYLKGQPKLGLWYPKDSPFDLVAYTDSDFLLGGKAWIGSQQQLDLLTKKHLINGIGVNADDSKLMLIGINLLLLLKVNAPRHKLTTAVEMDGKKIIITEASVRHNLQLNDEEGTDCLPNATIFEELTRMGAKTTAWNEFSSTMASAIICIATNQKFNFSKYIFKSMVKNLENVSGKFLMYPRFVQVFLEKQLEGMSNHKRIYVTPSHTKKIFGNIRRVGKGFSGRDTSLFLTMMVQAQQEQGEGSAMPTDPQHPPTIIQPSTSQPQLKQRSRRPKRKDTKVPQSSGPTDNVADEAVCWD
ncbi:putative ribonuclease H-like domain-containing protein [Tanacetum coccineum]